MKIKSNKNVIGKNNVCKAEGVTFFGEYADQ